ncbi:MAG: transposase [Syntrophomonadaceae bacterium]|nr:transposase [Syntrophomonadaceae bacterium]
MPRIAREYSGTGIYHIIVRGINRQTIFFEENDYHRYLETIERFTSDGEATVLGYCLMSNHVHLLIQENRTSISKIMKKIGTSYAYWYNRKYERTGHVFQDRFKSENIEDDSYLLTVIRYIHQNPVKAGITSKAEKYPWSSCRVYYGEKEYPPGLTQVSFILGIFAYGLNDARERFMQFIEEKNEDECLEDNNMKYLPDSEAVKIMTKLNNNRSIATLSNMPKIERDLLLQKFKEIERLSLRQIARLTGLGYQTINRA